MKCEIIDAEVKDGALSVTLFADNRLRIRHKLTEAEIKELVPDYLPDVMPYEMIIPKLIGKYIEKENIRSKSDKREKRLQKLRDKRKGRKKK